MNQNREKPRLKIGIIGLTRGSDFAKTFEANPKSEVVAVCEFSKNRIDDFLRFKKNVEVYSDYDKFLEHDLDAVMVAGYLSEHVPQAIKALESGRHVLSEVTACKTLAEGVALCRAVERSGRVYMYAENYCFFAYIQEMERVYKEGTIGEYMYGDCEYIHKFDMDEYAILIDKPDHWRSWIPATYYCTHALGPVLTITGTRPVKVSGFVVPNTLSRDFGRKGDDASVLICTMDNGAITRVIPWSYLTHKPYSLWYAIYGTKGSMENNRFRPQQTLNITLDNDPDTNFERSYQPKFRTYYDKKFASHGGSDFFVVKNFVDSIINGTPPPIDVYTAMDMTLPGILGYRSAIEGNVSLEVPDFRKEEIRKKYENDTWSPDPADRDIPGQPFPSILGDIQIPESVYKEVERRRIEENRTPEEARILYDDSV
jgi:predicted dehydrogenase